jgi:hypothetical protein
VNFVIGISAAFRRALAAAVTLAPSIIQVNQALNDMCPQREPGHIQTVSIQQRSAPLPADMEHAIAAGVTSAAAITSIRMRFDLSIASTRLQLVQRLLVMIDVLV